SSLLLYFFLYSSRDPPHLHSFPTRRSSDLARACARLCARHSAALSAFNLSWKTFRMHSTVSLRRAFSFAAALLLCALFSTDANAQQRRRTRPAVPHAPVADATEATAPRPPSPRDVLGFTPGDDRQIADWTQIRDYFARLDRMSDRVLLQTIGETTLGKPLVVAFISAPQNIRELN